MAETVTVRVAVAVDPEGNWTGWGIPSDDLIQNFQEAGMIDDLRPGEEYSILTAKLPVPTPTEVEASVERVETGGDDA